MLFGSDKMYNDLFQNNAIIILLLYYIYLYRKIIRMSTKGFDMETSVFTYFRNCNSFIKIAFSLFLFLKRYIKTTTRKPKCKFVISFFCLAILNLRVLPL